LILPSIDAGHPISTIPAGMAKGDWVPSWFTWVSSASQGPLPHFVALLDLIMTSWFKGERQ
jgi:hypothetical protein